MTDKCDHREAILIVDATCTNRICRECLKPVLVKDVGYGKKYDHREVAR
jgi:hypothetical protein